MGGWMRVQVKRSAVGGRLNSSMKKKVTYRFFTGNFPEAPPHIHIHIFN